MSLDETLALPTGVLVALGILLVVELILLVVGLVAWARTPAEHMPPPNRWVWLAVVALVNIAGPLAFLLVRRNTRPAVVPAAPPAAHGTITDTVDLLYRREDGR